ncbi:MAG TPA: hypothetical protein VIJ78_13565 [Pseudolabrys sp.]
MVMVMVMTPVPATIAMMMVVVVIHLDPDLGDIHLAVARPSCACFVVSD